MNRRSFSVILVAAFLGATAKVTGLAPFRLFLAESQQEFELELIPLTLSPISKLPFVAYAANQRIDIVKSGDKETYVWKPRTIAIFSTGPRSEVPPLCLQQLQKRAKWLSDNPPRLRKRTIAGVLKGCPPHPLEMAMNRSDSIDPDRWSYRMELEGVVGYSDKDVIGRHFDRVQELYRMTV